MTDQKFEKLLSKDPIGAFDKIKSNYKRYFETMYKFKDEELDKKKNIELENNDNLYKEPYLEILPEYVNASNIDGVEAKDIIELIPRFNKGFHNEATATDFISKFIKPGLMNYPPYGHQVEMFEKVFVNKKNTAITSGTGSGKTESFLLPLFGEIFNEAKTWKAPNYKAPNWFDGNGKDKYEGANQRIGENRTPAVRALIMYPMNALVEDQMTRLRKALDCDHVRTYFDSENGLKGNRIYFGRYNSSTIGSKGVNMVGTKEHKQCYKDLKEIKKRSNDLTNFANNQNNEHDETLYIGPRLTSDVRTSEMITRWDMQEFPPDILISNFSMLSVMLMREAESSMFEKTKEWLEEKDEDGNRSNVFHLIIDELHLFRGTPGTEIAYLIRMLLDAIGIEPVIDGKPNKQLRIMASSASLGDEKETQKFLEEFFGVYFKNGDKAFEIQKGSDYLPNISNEINFENFKCIPNDYPFLNVAEQINIKNELAKSFGYETIENFFKGNSESIYAHFSNTFKSLDDRVVPKSLKVIKTELFNSNEQALRGFLIIRADEDVNKNKLPRIRIHQFFKYIDGLWGELLPQNPNETQSAFGKLMFQQIEVVQNNSTIHKVLELLRCEGCGAEFIGGNKKTISDERVALSLNTPELSKIPNRNPTPMIQNKWYHEYGIFWPTEKQPILDPESKFYFLESGVNNIIQRDDFNCTNREGKGTFVDTEYRANWQKAYLNPFTGEVSRTKNNTFLISGYFYLLINDIPVNRPINHSRSLTLNIPNYKIDNPIEALPHVCPACARDYSKRKYTKSPIRSFRTGISRSNQILSKELMYQLSGDSPKLVGFSDSRQDAADQAFGIEQEHYRDMVRMLFLECVQELTNPNPLIEDLINETIQLQAGIFSNIQNYITIPNAQQIAIDTLTNPTESRSKYLNPRQTFKILDLLEHPNNDNDCLNGLLIKKMLELGINPHGVDYYKQYPKDTKNKSFHWSELYDFKKLKIDNTTNIQDRIGDANYAPTYLVSEVRQSILVSIYQNSFGRYMDLNTESAGIGYISLLINDDNLLSPLKGLLPPTIDLKDFLNAYIRVLGDHYRFDDPDSQFELSLVDEYSKFSTSLRNPIRKISIQNNIKESDLGNSLYEVLSKLCGVNIKLNPNHLQFTVVDKQSGYYKCPNCGKIHLHKGMGICTNTQCIDDLPQTRTGTVDQIHRSHFISFDLLIEKRKAKRLHTEELTGQTDNQAERQLEFKGIIVSNNQRQDAEKLSKEIDMINVTTTMEVGVDIGSLEAIYQGNMPPTRYNYQQRVGRGGRRGQAYSAAVTFCRGKSHDTYYYYKATDEMVGSIAVAPRLTIAPLSDGNNWTIKIPIVRRMLTKNILKFAFIEILPKINNDNTENYSDTHGEFGHVEQWDEIKPKLETWVNDNHNLIDRYVHKYLDQFNQNNYIDSNIAFLSDWFKNCLVQNLQSAVDQKTNNAGLAEIFAEAGFLPMFGMPSNQRVLYHGVDKRHKIVKQIDRPLEQSITEFAPGSIKTKDKGFYESAGLTIPLNYGNIGHNRDGIKTLDRYDPKNNNATKFDALEYSFNITINEDDKSIQSIGSFNEDLLSETTVKRLVIPKAFRTVKIEGNQGSKSENSDSKNNFTSSSLFANTDGNSSQRQINNCKINLFGITDNSNGEIWHVNDNNGNYFKGKSTHNFRDINNEWHNGPVIIGAQQLTLNPNFIIEKYLSVPNNESFHGDIALGSRKVTELLKLEINSIPDEINLSIHSGNSSAIKSAFYSAAYILQRVLADKLDIQPSEIEISELKINENGIPIIYLSDALANGAGFVSYLFEGDNFVEMISSIVNFENNFIKSLIDDQHFNECKTSCQKCLNSYDNSGYHHILDWRLGIGLLRLMINENFRFGIDQDLQYADLNDLIETMNSVSNMISSSNPLSYELKNGEYGLAYIKNIPASSFDDFNHFIVHPLWNKDYLVNNSNGFNPGVTINEYNNYFDILRTNKI